MTEKTLILPASKNGNGADTHYRLTMMVPKRRYLSYLRERWWVVLVCVALALGGALAVATLKRPSYSSFAELYTSGEVQLGVANLFNEESQTYYGTQIELLKSSRLANAALERLAYAPKPGEKMPVVEVIRPQGTALLQVKATSQDAGLAQRYLQALIDEYLAYKKETRRSTSEDIVASLTEQLATKEKDLKAGQDQWSEFQRSNNVAVLAEESRSAGVYLSELDLQLAKLKLDCSLLSAGQNPMPIVQGDAAATNETGHTAGGVSTLGTSLADLGVNNQAGSIENALQSVKTDLAVLRAQRDQALADHGPAAAHGLADAATNMEHRLAILEKQAQEEKKTILDQLQTRISAIESSIPVSEAKILDINERLAKGDRLRTDVAREQTYYDHLLGMLQSANLGLNVQPERVSVLQPPSMGAPADRNLGLRVTMSLVFGLAAGLGLVFGWYMVDDRFVSVRDVKEQFGETVLGLVPQIKVPRGERGGALLRENDSRMAFVESFRHLRSALLLSSNDDGCPKTLLFTGTATGEGKTTVAMNLARMLAVTGLRVVLVDTDLRNGQMHELFGKSNDMGLLDYLRGEAAATAVLCPTRVPGLAFIPRGTRTAEAEGVFLRPGLDKLLGELKRGHDFVILDGSPILAADDAALLAPHADVVVMIVRPFYSAAHSVRQALDMLYQRQAKEVAIILNQARKDDLAGHYAEGGTKPVSSNGVLPK